MQSEKNFLGKDGFVWFFGVVEDRMDPLPLKRVRVRCIGFHTADKTELPTDNLPWAQVGLPTTSAGTSGIGETSSLVEGTVVLGFFLDGAEAQLPLILQTVPSIPQAIQNPSLGFNDPRTERSGFPKKVTGRTLNLDGSGSSVTSQDNGQSYPVAADESDINRLQRNTQLSSTIVEHKKNTRTLAIETVSGKFDEPEVPYDAVYPFNNVRETESGHVVEFDDTPGKERIHTFHRTGTFDEIHPDGSRVTKVVNDNFSYTLKNSYEHVEASKYVTVDKGMELFVNRDKEGDGLKIKIGDGGNFEVTVESGDVILNVNGGNVTRYISGDLTETIDGNVTRKVGGNVVEEVGGNMVESVAGNSVEDVTGIKAIQGAQVLIN